MNQIILSLGLGFLMMSCGFAVSPDDKPEEQRDLHKDFADHHTAKISLDYYGIYEGVLPCADCDGIKTVIHLRPENRYHKMSTYLGKGDNAIFEAEGNFSWEESGNVILLDVDGQEGRYFVGENFILLMGQLDEPVYSSLDEFYKLHKRSDNH